MDRFYPVVKTNLYWNSLSGLVQCYDAITAKKGVHYQSISHFIGLMHKSLKISNFSLIVSFMYLMHSMFATPTLVCFMELCLMFPLRTQILLINLKVFLFLSNPFKPLAIFVLPNSALLILHPDWGGLCYSTNMVFTPTYFVRVCMYSRRSVKCIVNSLSMFVSVAYIWLRIGNANKHHLVDS